MCPSMNQSLYPGELNALTGQICADPWRLRREEIDKDQRKEGFLKQNWHALLREGIINVRNGSNEFLLQADFGRK